MIFSTFAYLYIDILLKVFKNNVLYAIKK